MTHILPGVDADAIMRAKIMAPSELKVQFMKPEGSRFRRDERVALKERQMIEVPTGNDHTMFFEMEGVVGSSVGAWWRCDE